VIPKHRLEALSDGVYAIALTLLVLELKIPPLPHSIPDEVLSKALLELIPKGLAWLLSFWVIALFWLAQQRLYRLCLSIDTVLVRIELAQLALISLFPFSNILLGEHGGRTLPAVIYSGHLFALALLSMLRTRHFLRYPELQSPEVTPHAVRALRIRAWLLTGSTLATVLLGFFAPTMNMLALFPLILLPRIARF
jgi:uncharacterized membrane protein